MRNGANKNEWNGMKRSFWSGVKQRVRARTGCEGRVRLPRMNGSLGGKRLNAKWNEQKQAKRSEAQFLE